ncbi:hypothetical protein Zmor_019281 [Zophobas morio]|uniref:CLIP domain-containing serine protease n=1 Tax=Zophobas morio TaxID=2755281 RepID=A0AA38I1J8_9CUCU|nr:hypothetical protein Zmor_019281 [Zophobas morio]
MILLKTTAAVCACLMTVTNIASACQTPDNQRGQCKPLKDCSLLYNLLDNLTNQTTTYLRRSLCGGTSSKTNPNVCCPRKLPRFEDVASGCHTPDFLEGECKPIKECSVLYLMLDDLTEQKVIFLRKSRCGGGSDNTNPRVCCPKEPGLRQSAVACKTPHNKQGQCKPLKQCSFLYSLLDNLTNQTATYLRQSLCNVDSDRTNPNVCCPKDAPIFEPPASSVVPKPQTNFCRIPTGQNGTCKPRQECPSLSGDVPRTPKCGNSRVCCPPDSAVSLPPNELLPSKAECGMSTESRIVGGNKTSIDEYTWMVLLQYESKNGTLWFGCGGSLITKRYVLTARHCLSTTLKRVRVGEWNTTTNPDCAVSTFGSDCAPEVIDVPIERQIPYKDKTSFRNDIGLLRLRREIEFGDFISPICLPTTPNEIGMSYTGKKLVVAGWGKTEAKVPSDVKLKLVVPVVPLAQCVAGLRKAFRTDEITLQESQICAGGEKGKDTCTGDSGGPLMYRGIRWYIAGIVSYGSNNPCGQEGTPSVYVKVSKYIPWIINNIKP